MHVLRMMMVLVGGWGSVAVGWCADHERGPVGHWKLAGNAVDSSPQRLDGHGQGVQFSAQAPGGDHSAAVFDGRSAHIQVKPNAKLRPGTGDFSIALWVHTGTHAEDEGDLVTCYDSQKRMGFQLALRTNTGVTSSAANVRQLQFGIDAGSEPRWTEVGHPGGATLAFALAVHDGHLYAGTANNAPKAQGHVYRYAGNAKWLDCGAPDQCNAITSLISFAGKLYAASGKYRFAGSALPESDNPHRGGGIFRYLGEQKWEEVGRLPHVEAVGGMVAFQGRLYASSLYRPAGFFRYESDNKWTALPVPDGKRVEALAVFDHHLWASSYDDGRVYRYDGTVWKDLGRLGDNTQTYSFVVYRGRLCVGTWPSGKVYRWNDNQWEDLGQLGEEREVMGMLVHNGHLYAGSLPLAAVYRYDGEQRWTKTAQLDTTPDVKYRRVWTMAQYDGRLFCSTLPSGKVHAMDAGPCVTDDRAFPPGWQHVAAVKRGGLLTLYVNGKSVAESRRFDPAQFDLTNDSPLLLGSGNGGFWRGALSDVRLYQRALSEAEIRALAKP
ncbi:MAG: LamG domain-containing protein [Bacteroidales bacterium]|nr:LamG domain-containing protein [Bacteroidales bacterium]